MKITVISEWGDIYTNIDSIVDDGDSLLANSSEKVCIFCYANEGGLGEKAMKYARDMIINANYYGRKNVLINFYNFGKEVDND